MESESSALASTRRVEPNTEMEPGPQIIPPEGNTDREGGSYYHSLRQVKAQRKKTLSRGQESWVWRLLRCVRFLWPFLACRKKDKKILQSMGGTS